MAELAVVAGGGGGIGGACAVALAATHDLVLCVDRDLARAEQTARSIRVAGTDAAAFRADAVDSDFGEQVATRAAELGHVRSMVHALAHEEHRAALDLSLDSVLTSYRVGPMAAFSLFRACVVGGFTTPGASFTAIGSLHERQPFRRCLGYNAAHAALGQVVRTLAHEWAPRGLRVNAVVPGWISTPGELALYGADHLDRTASLLPLGAFGSVEQVAAAVVFLSSAAAGYVSGSFLTVDGALEVSLARLPGEEPS